ncbi:MAG: flavodoxin family protein [Eubacteriales bacterium]|nr:flavodoxin family protein [Eubacteriales bacterium]
MKTAILFESWHHGNTKKLCEAIKKEYDVTLLDVKEDAVELEEYDLICIASGVSFSKFYKEIEQATKDKMPEGKKVFLMYTCGKLGQDFAKNIKKTLSLKKCIILGTYCCKGHDTFGPLKLIGGLNKENPNEDDIQGAVKFYGEIIANFNKGDAPNGNVN